MRACNTPRHAMNPSVDDPTEERGRFVSETHLSPRLGAHRWCGFARPVLEKQRCEVE